MGQTGCAEAAETLNPCPKVQGGVQFFRRPAAGLFPGPGGSAGGADGDELVAGAEKERAVRQRGGREAGFAEGVFRGEGELVRGGHDEDVAQFAREENIPAVRHGRRGHALRRIRGEAFAVAHLAGLRIEAGERPIVAAAVEQAADEDRGLHVVAAAVVVPGDGRVFPVGVVGRDVAAGVGADGAHRGAAAVGAGEIDEVAGGERGRHGDVAAAVEFPELLAGGEIIAASVVPAVDGDLGAAAGGDDGGGAPGRDVGARGAPDFATVREIEGGEVGAFLDVALDDHFSGVDNR